MIQLYTKKSKRIYKLRELTKEFSQVLNRRINLKVVFPQYCICISQQMKNKQFKDYNSMKKNKENKINLTEVYELIYEEDYKSLSKGLKTVTMQIGSYNGKCTIKKRKLFIH